MFETRIVPDTSRAADYGEGVKRYVISVPGGMGPQAYLVAASASDAEAHYREKHGFKAEVFDWPEGRQRQTAMLGRVKVKVIELED
jgi:hypothetical protein